jgi:transcriptional regulator with XRE-family HTH domain
VKVAEEGMQSPLARKLRMLRAREGITLAEVEERSGVTRESIGELERGKRIPFGSTLQKLARAYGVTLAELLEEEAPALTGPKDEAREIGQPHEWAKDFGARLHGMSDQEWIDHVRALESVDELAEEYRDLMDEAKMLHAAYAAGKWQRPEARERRIELFRSLREMRAYRLADLAAAAKLRKADELFREVVQALEKLTA